MTFRKIAESKWVSDLVGVYGIVYNIEVIFESQAVQPFSRPKDVRGNTILQELKQAEKKKISI